MHKYSLKSAIKTAIIGLGSSVALIGLCSGISASFSQSELKKMNYVGSFLEKNGDAIDKRAGEQASSHLQARAMRQDALRSMEYMRTYSQDDFVSYDQFVEVLGVYIAAFKDLEKKEAYMASLPSYSDAEAEILALQNNLVESIWGNAIDGPIHDQTSMALIVDAMIPFLGSLNAKRTLSADSKVDNKKEIANIDLSSILDVAMSNSVDGTNESIQANVDMDIIMPGNDMLYMNIIDLSYTEDLEDPDEETMIVLNEMKRILNGRYLELPLKGEMLSPSMLNMNEVMIKEYLKTKPLLSFYHKEGASYYGFLNENACMLLQSLGMDDDMLVAGCLDFIAEKVIQTEGKSPFVLTIEDDTSSLGVRNYDGMQPAGVEQLSLSWDKEKILSAFAPLSFTDGLIDSNMIKYSDGQRSLFAKEANDHVDIAVFTDPKNTNLTILKGEMLIDGVDVSMEGEFTTKKDGMSGSVTVIISQGSIEFGTISFVIGSKRTTISGVNATVPQNLITLEELEREMEEAIDDVYEIPSPDAPNMSVSIKNKLVYFLQKSAGISHHSEVFHLSIE